MQVEEAIAFVYKDSLRYRDKTEVDREIANIVAIHDQEGEDMESEESSDVPEMEN